MAAIKVLARGWKLEIQNPDTLAYKEVKGLSSLTFDGSKNDADTTTFDDSGRQTHIVASRGRTLAMEGYFLEEPTTGVRDDGQLLVDQLADAIGTDSLGTFKLTSPAGVIREFTASANVSGIGGGNDDPTGWSAELTVSGAADLADVAVTAITATPDTLALGVGDVSSLIGDIITFAPTNATDRTLTYEITVGADKAAVTSEGRVVGLAAGAATLTITPSAGTAETIAITVS